MQAASELALLVEAEARLDRELAAAREQAIALDRAARERIAAAAVAVVDEVDAERARVIAAIEAETAARLAAITEQAEADIARFAAVRDDRATAIATPIVDALIARVRAEVPP